MKGQDLLHLDQPSKDKAFIGQKNIYETLGLSDTPLENVKNTLSIQAQKIKRNIAKRSVT